MKYYSSGLIIYDNSTEVVKLLVYAMEVGFLVSLARLGKDEDGYIVHHIRIGVPDNLPINILNEYLSAIDSDLSWNEIKSDIFYSDFVFDKDNSEDWDLSLFATGADFANQRTGNEIRIPDDDLFKIETLGLNESIESQFLQHGYQFVEDILDKMNQKCGRENLLIILGNYEVAYKELLTKLKEQGHI